VAPPTALLDSRARALSDLRISVTDRCNFRCSYCMPKEIYRPGFRFLPRADILHFEEIARLSRVFVGLGTKKLRITGGEPLLRADLPVLISLLAPLGTDLALTTNGSLLAERAEALASAGLERVTVSLDSLDDAVFRRMNDVDFPVGSVLDGIEAARSAGLLVKINCVVRRGVNDHTIADMARHFRGSGLVLRFIEFMDVGTQNGWRLDQVVSAQEILDNVSREVALVPLEENYAGEVARRHRYADGSGEIGVIASVTEPFCKSCTRARLSAEGKLYTCLFATLGTDLREPLRSGASDEELAQLVTRVWRARSDRYSELRTEGTRSLPKIEMSYIGG
jgi:cyclic pyranopterin phosphate synthase